MAIAQAYSNLPNPLTFPAVFRYVLWKGAWSDPWQWIPYLDPISCENSASPSIGRAKLMYHYGYIARETIGAFQGFYPLNISGGYVSIVAEDAYGASTLWTGVVDWEQHKPHGTVAWFQGPQEFQCFDLKYLFDRVQIYGSYTENGLVDRPIKFNKRNSHGLVQRGNRSASVGGDGVYVFGSTDDKWNSLQIIQYLVWYYAPSGIAGNVRIVGDYSSLQSVEDEWDFTGQSLKAALDRLIDKNRGLSWDIQTDGTTIWVYIWSNLIYPISVGDITIPANSNQVIANFDGRIDMQPIITLNRLAQFTSVWVRGGPLSVCGTVAFADGTLEEDWTDTQQTNYENVTGTDSTEKDKERETEKYAPVFNRFRLPHSWDGNLGDGSGGTKYNALPGYDKNANWDPTLLASLFQVGKKFERHTCIAATVNVDGEPEWIPMFAIAKNPDDSTYIFVDKFDLVSYKPAHVAPYDKGLAFWCKTSPGHAKALNQLITDPIDSDTDPQWDYSTLLATVMFETDAYPSVLATIPGGVETGKVKTILYPRAEVWVIMPGTVLDITEGDLIKQSTWGVVRDDTDTLRVIAALALAWYGVPHAELAWTYRSITAAYLPGTMIRGMAANWTLTDINAPVTRRSYDFVNNCTSYQTGFNELTGAVEVGHPAQAQQALDARKGYDTGAAKAVEKNVVDMVKAQTDLMLMVFAGVPPSTGTGA